MSQNLSSAAVVIGALRVNSVTIQNLNCVDQSYQMHLLDVFFFLKYSPLLLYLRMPNGVYMHLGCQSVAY